jgi:hypothetical protein
MEKEEWNKSLGKAISLSFINAIPRLQVALPSDSTLGPRLMEYIPDPAEFGHDAFLQDIAKGIVTKAKTIKILVSRNDKWIAPTETLIFPSTFFIDGLPLFDENKLNKFFKPPLKYLKGGAAYTSTRCQRILKVLECRTFTFSTVEEILKHSLFAFSQMSDSWVAKFFRFLHGLSVEDKSPFLKLPFLKLDNGTWVSQGPSAVYLPTSSLAVPDQIKLVTLDRGFYAAMQADKDQLAVRFLENELNLPRLTSQSVVKAIIAHHQQIANHEIGPFPPDPLFEHAKYLYEHRESALKELPPTWLRELNTSFQLLDRERRHSSSRQIVLDRDIEWYSTVFRLSNIGSRSLRVLHPYYEGMMPFINEYLNVAKFPPLTDQFDNLSTFYLGDMAPMKLGDNKVLALLAEQWISKGRELLYLSSVSDPLRKMAVRCENDSFQVLETCYLPTNQLKPLLQPAMNILSLPDPDNVKWKFLELLGVRFSPDMGLYLDQLRNLRKTALPEESLKIKAGQIYTMLERVTRREEYGNLRYSSHQVLTDGKVCL